jgi:hypothetical protein
MFMGYCILVVGSPYKFLFGIFFHPFPSFVLIFISLAPLFPASTPCFGSFVVYPSGDSP